MNDPDMHLTRRESERLLDDPAAYDHVLGWALTAAKSPAHRDELRREDAEVAAFHAARLAPARTSRTHFVSPVRLGGRAATQAVVATAAVVALASGGFALTGSVDLPGLPDLPGRASDRATEAGAGTPSSARPTATPSREGGRDTHGPASGKPAKPRKARTTRPGPAGSTRPTPNLRGLCKAYQATDRSRAGKSLDSAAFTALATEAGGADAIATYCVALVGEPKATDPGQPTDQPTPGKPTDQPTPGKPTDKPTDKPGSTPSTGKPTDRPTDKPGNTPSTGKPTDKPTDEPGNTPSTGKPTDAPSESTSTDNSTPSGS
jgi:hypothetical protein